SRRMRQTPAIIAVTNEQLQDLLQRLQQQALNDEDVALIRAVLQSYLYVTELVEDKNTSLRRLRQLLFGGRTEKTSAVLGQQAAPPAGAVPSSAAAGPALPGAAARGAAAGAAEAPAASSNVAEPEPARPGHGRNGADAYAGAER